VTDTTYFLAHLARQKKTPFLAPFSPSHCHLMGRFPPFKSLETSTALPACKADASLASGNAFDSWLALDYQPLPCIPVAVGERHVLVSSPATHTVHLLLAVYYVHSMQKSWNTCYSNGLESHMPLGSLLVTAAGTSGARAIPTSNPSVIEFARKTFPFPCYHGAGPWYQLLIAMDAEAERIWFPNASIRQVDR
jgi:hypothetical protein